MRKYSNLRQAQSLLEYAVLICVIISTLLIMQFYIKRAYQGRIKQEADELGQQYSPGHTTSLSNTTIATNTTSYTGGEFVKDSGGRETVPEGMSVSYSVTNTTFTRREGVDSYAK